ncbi:hypothetical protein ZIOFF_020155 [Zingiber officinale]|uniref:Expansin n=1 Tax=Zingiber officinale TaxID=94328 RepID=A0A8J5HIW8_ZINOF|nr:hypothetical protein ZIOFF_020155 [Zingiber officinale]
MFLMLNVVSKMKGCIRQIEHLNPSGASEQDIKTQNTQRISNLTMSRIYSKDIEKFGTDIMNTASMKSPQQNANVGSSEQQFFDEAFHTPSSPYKTIMTSDQYGILKIISTPKEFLARETSDGMMVNVVEGLKLHENFLDSSEVTELVSLANEMRAAGHRGELPGQTLVTLKRPLKGHGREMIQLGVLINEEPIEDGNTILTSEDHRGDYNGSLKLNITPGVKCVREGGVHFTIDGKGFFYNVLISNVAGAGDIVAVKIKGSATGWLHMGRTWGQNWHISADLQDQALSFEVSSSDGVTLT